MTSFINPHFATSHPGADRLEATLAAAQASARSFSGSRGLATLLLAAMVSALVVVANQVIDTVSDGHLLAAWIALWTVAFAALALFAAPARRLSTHLRQGWAGWAVARKAAAADEQLWSIALQDARVMADITCAISRSKPEAVLPAAAVAVAPVMTRANYVGIAAESANLQVARKASQVRIQRMLAAANGY
ncbi:MAG: hypothetical protein WB821_06005 [Burkholderiaceae bacterium]